MPCHKLIVSLLICCALSTSSHATGADCFAIQRQFEAGNSTAVNGYSLGIIRTRSGLLYTPQCNPNGTFTQVQCNSPMNGSAMNSEVTFTCWCVDPATGVPTDEYPTNSYARKHASECTYINTTEGCMGKTLFSPDASTCIQCIIGEPFYSGECDSFGVYCGSLLFVTPIQIGGCCEFACPTIAGMNPTQYIPLFTGLTCLYIVIVIILAGLGAICCVFKCKIKRLRDEQPTGQTRQLGPITRTSIESPAESPDI